MTDNLSINVKLNSQSQSDNGIENISPNSQLNSSEMSTEEKLLSMETPISRFLANNGGGLENAKSSKMIPFSFPPGSVLAATIVSDMINPWVGGYQSNSSESKLTDLAKIPLRVVGTAVTLGTYSTGLGGYEPVEFKERGDLRVQHDGDTGSTIIERLDPVDGKWKPEEGVAYRDFASETGGEAKFVVNDEILTASTVGRPIHEPGKDDYVDITPYPNRADHDTTTPPNPMAEQDKDNHILSNPLPGEKLPWKTETPADRLNGPTVMLNEEQDSGSIQGASGVGASGDVASDKGTLSGSRTRIPNKADEETRRSLIRENEAADIMVNNGFDVMQNPVLPDTTSKPDQMILKGSIRNTKFENVITDVYSPAENTPARNIRSTINEKVNDKLQGDTIVLNMADSQRSIGEVVDAIKAEPVPNLRNVIVIEDGKVDLLPLN